MPPPEGTIVSEKPQTSFTETFKHMEDPGSKELEVTELDSSTSDGSFSHTIDHSLSCISCGNETSGAHRCPKCNGCIHVFCGRSEEEGYGAKVWCKACDVNSRNQECNIMRAGIKRSQEKSHERMLTASGKRLKPALVGDAVIIPVPHPDRLCAIGARNILGSICDKQDDIYTVATSGGVISYGYTRNQFEVSLPNLMTTPFTSTNIVTQTELMQNASLGTGTDACKCKKCINRTCSCRKSGKKCSTKCHKGLKCKNKEV